MIPSGRAKSESTGEGGEAVTGQDFVLEVDSAENSSFHVGGQRVPPFVFKSHCRLSSRWAVGTI